VVRAGTDLELTWRDNLDPAGEYQVLSLDCDADLDGVCDTAPDAATMSAQPFDSVAVGVERLDAADAINRASHLVFYNIRGASPCSLTPGSL